MAPSSYAHREDCILVPAGHRRIPVVLRFAARFALESANVSKQGSCVLPAGHGILRQALAVLSEASGSWRLTAESGDRRLCLVGAIVLANIGRSKRSGRAWARFWSMLEGCARWSSIGR